VGVTTSRFWELAINDVVVVGVVVEDDPTKTVPEVTEGEVVTSDVEEVVVIVIVLGAIKTALGSAPGPLPKIPKCI
ncbi:unnamed protein product, partial [Acidithrix sp. C25]